MRWFCVLFVVGLVSYMQSSGFVLPVVLYLPVVVIHMRIPLPPKPIPVPRPVSDTMLYLSETHYVGLFTFVC
ncbi:hypothetical protein C8T65DRAFT_62548 [Cerioporus squamosus]|nr:hypothetical protein C8T65DRAFT_62548 [Cerioporus squamosus]